MRIMVYNILDGGTGRIDPIAEVIRQADPDCVIVPEASDAGDRSEFEKLAARLKMDYFLAQSPRGENASVGLLSKLEIIEAGNLAATDARFSRAALRAVVRSGGAHLGIIGVHLHAGEALADEAIRITEIPALLDAARPWRDVGIPHLLAGDFNATSPHQIIDLQKLRPKARQRISVQNNIIPRDAIAAILAAGYLDSHAIGRTPEEFGCSFTTSHPATRVDYVFIPEAMRASVSRSVVLSGQLAKFASDHFPILCDVALRE